MLNQWENNIIERLKEFSLTMVGTYEISSAAYGGALIKHQMGDFHHMVVEVSAKTLGNSLKAVIPSTQVKGIGVAVALGYIIGEVSKRWMILDLFHKRDVLIAEEMILSHKIQVQESALLQDYEIRFNVYDLDQNKTTMTIDMRQAFGHCEHIFEKPDTSNPWNEMDANERHLEEAISKIKQFVENADDETLKIADKFQRVNFKAAELGLQERTGIQLGAALLKMGRQRRLQVDIPMKARVMVAAAVDNRMGGGGQPMMSLGVNGNESILLSVPIIAVGKDHNMTEIRMNKAVLFAIILYYYLKEQKESQYWGGHCGSHGGVSAAAAISWMLYGNHSQIAGACKNMMTNAALIQCQSYGESCIARLSMLGEEAVLAAYLANEDIIFS